MSIAVKRAKAPQNTHSRWRALKRAPQVPLSMFVLLEVKGRVWTFQHPKSLAHYRCELDALGNEQWFSNNRCWRRDSNVITAISSHAQTGKAIHQKPKPGKTLTD